MIGSTSLRQDARRHLTSLGADAGVDVRTVDITTLVRGLPTVSRYAPETWGRIFAARIVDTDRVLYVDADALVVGSLEGLAGMTFDDRIMLALPDPEISTHGHRGDEFVRRAHSPPSAPYFNTGVLLIDVNRWKRADIELRVRRMVESGLPVDYVDQDALNAVIWGRWSPLDERWHRMVDGSETGTEGARILHFTGAVKPWHRGATSGQLRDIYEAEAARVGWDLRSDRRPSVLEI